MKIIKPKEKQDNIVIEVGDILRWDYGAIHTVVLVIYDPDGEYLKLINLNSPCFAEYYTFEKFPIGVTLSEISKQLERSVELIKKDEYSLGIEY